MQPNIGELVAQIWEDTLRETPDPWRNPSLYISNMTYRERLDYQPINYFGEKIPRIVIVRNNIRRLGRIPPVNLP